MTTTIKSTGLDFDAIKNNLKTFLDNEEFSDYDFEASGLSNILDVLSYNTHFNGLIANFALNESFLGTAQLRSSLVSLSEGIGYIPDSKTAAFSVVNLTISDPVGPAQITMPAGTKFNTTVDDTSYTFQTREPAVAFNDNGLYEFYIGGSKDIKIYEGVSKNKIFLAGPYSENDVYIIPNENLDLETAEVRVYESPTSTNFITYINLNRATTLTESSTIYVLKESPNGYFELTFGNGNTLGKVPVSGNKIEVSFLSVNGSSPNGARNFTPATQLSGRDIGLVVKTTAAGGSSKESIDSIRKNAPFQYAAQNRMVTAADYSSLILRNFSSLISDIKAWGGEDHVPADYGSVYLSIKFLDSINENVKSLTKQEIVNLAQDLSVVSFNVKYSDPVETYVEVSTVFQFNPQLTSQTSTTVEQQVRTTIQSYFERVLGNFDQSFRRSNMLTAIDDTNTAILSSRAEIKMQQRLIPQVVSVDNNGEKIVSSRFDVPTTYVLTYPTRIRDPLLDEYVVISSSFVYNNKICRIQNKLGTSIIQIINLGTSTVLEDNVGQYDALQQTVTLVGFAPSSIIAGTEHIAISVLPANESAISPSRNNILLYDADASTVTAFTTNTI